MKQRPVLLLLLMVIGMTVLYSSYSQAGVDLPWSTTYDCGEWSSYSSPVNCSRLEPTLNNWCSPQNIQEQITGSANHAAGAGGRGQRHWIGDGLNNNSGGTKVIFNSAQSEVWVRWYMRFQPGFKWSSYQGFKVLYFYKTNGGGPFYYMIAYNPDQLSMYAQTGDMKHYSCDNCGWETLFPTGQSDGAWHAFEIRAKMESRGQSNGIFQAWVDGKQVINATNVNYGMANNGDLFSYFTIGSNSKYPDNGGCNYVDYDDVAVSNTGYIGPLKNNGIVAKPNAPANLR